MSYSAGVVFFTHTNGDVRVLLGREQFLRGWRGSLKWSDFGGRAAAVDQHCPAATAAREMYEETLGLFGNLKTTLLDGQYVCRLVLRRPGRRHPRYLYLVEVPWPADLARRFHGRREHVKHILYTVARVRQLQQQLLRRHRAPVPDYPALLNRQMVRVTGLMGVEERTDGTCWVELRYTRTPCHDALRARRRCDDRAHTPTPTTPPTPTNDQPRCKVRVDPAAADVYARMIELHNWLQVLIQAFPPDVATSIMSYQRLDNVPYWLPYVRKEFLEKDSIRAWTLDELHDMLARPGEHRMRSSFAPALQVLLRYMSTAPGTNWRASPPP